MSARKKALFSVDGDSYACLIDRVARGEYLDEAGNLQKLARDRHEAAKNVWNAIWSLMPLGETELGFRFTDRVLRQTIYLRRFSYRYVQKGLNALEELGAIKRKRRNGRRKIKVLAFAAKGSKPETTSESDPQGTTAADREQTIPMIQPEGAIPVADRVPLKDRPAYAQRLLDALVDLQWGLEIREAKLFPIKLSENSVPLSAEFGEHLRGPYRTHVYTIVERHGGRYPQRE
jgi:hypothetical protein